MLIKQGGEIEEEENATDYIAMHAYVNPLGSQKILEDKNAIIKSTYTNEQNYMLRLELPSSEYFNKTHAINLVLDQYQRQKDLFFNIRVFSSAPFVTQRAQFDFKHKQVFDISNIKGGGPPNSPLFYLNP